MTIFVVRDARLDTAAGVLRAARHRRRAADLAEAELLQLAVEWALMHPADSSHQAAGLVLRGFGQTELALAGEGAPTIAEFAVAELASTVGLSTEAGKRYLGEGLELCYRLPTLWRRVTSGDLPAWKARRVARETVRLSRDAAAYVDTHVGSVAHTLTPAQLDRVVNEAIGRFMPGEVERLAAESWDKRHVTVHDQLVSFTGTMRVEAELDIADALDFDAAVAAGAAQRLELGSTESGDVRRSQAVGDLARGQLPLDVGTVGASSDAARPPRPQAQQVVLHVHLSEAAVRGDDPVARLERGDSLVSVDHVRAWCGNPSAEVVVKPVLDLAGCTWCDSDQVPESIAEQVALRDRTCVFPWCTRPARRCHPDDPPATTTTSSPEVGPVRPARAISRRCADDITGSRRIRRGATSCSIRAPTSGPPPHGYQFLRDETGTLDVSPDRPRLPDS